MIKALPPYLVFLCLLPAFGQLRSEYQPGTITAVAARPSKAADGITSYDISVRVGNTLYVGLYTPPPGAGTPLYAAGREMLFKVGEKTITFNDMLGRPVDVPIESKTPVAAPAPEPIDADSPPAPTKSTLVIGLSGVKENTSGNLAIEKGNLRFVHSKNVSDIPLSSTLDLVNGSDKVGPYGSGRFLSLFRSKLDTLTIQYCDGDGGLHGAIFTMPSGNSEPLRARLIAAGAHTIISSESSVPEASELRDEARTLP